jgi:DNA repair photolyase
MTQSVGAAIKNTEIEVKHILTASKLKESAYTINPYVGCVHRCVYCYACYMKRFSNHAEAWGTFADAKVNAPNLLPRDLKKVKQACSLFFGSATDAYQPLESKYKLTRSLLNVLRESEQLPFLRISILTKSDLVLRDLDLLKTFPQISVGFSIALTNEKARRLFEPCASPISQRLNALRILHQEGIRTFVFIGPILPYFTPLEELFDAIDDRADYVFGETLNTQCGNFGVVLQAVRRFDKTLQIPFAHAVQSREFWDKTQSEFERLTESHEISNHGFFRHDQ